MKTAEVAIEHILTGLLTLCAFVLPFFPGLSVSHNLFNTEKIIGILGIAYLFGVVFDKLADTILSPFEQWLRLKIINKHLNSKEIYLDNDPFPQDVLEYELRRDDDGRLKWMDSLRSRIRTARGFAVFGLPAALGIIIHWKLSWECRCDAGAHLSLNWRFYLPIAFNLFFVVMSVLISYFEWRKMLKTYELSEYSKTRMKEMKENKKEMYLRALPYFFILLTFAITMGFIATVDRAKHSEFISIAVFSTVIALLALWVWYSITETYLKFVYRKLTDFKKC